MSFSLKQWRGIRIPQAVLTHAQLNKADLSSADLTGVNLTSAQLRGANFSNAILSNVQLGGLPDIECQARVVSIAVNRAGTKVICGLDDGYIQK